MCLHFFYFEKFASSLFFFIISIISSYLPFNFCMCNIIEINYIGLYNAFYTLCIQVYVFFGNKHRCAQTLLAGGECI